MPEVVLSVDADSSLAAAGLSQLRNYGQRAVGELNSVFAKTIAVGGIIEATKATIEYGARVEDLSRRFGVSTTAIQQFGNVAERSGSSMEAMTMGFNRLEVARSKALGGNHELIASFERLGVTEEDLRNLSLEDLMLKLGHSSMNAADMVKILGRNGTELRQTLRGLGDGTEELSKEMDPKHTAALKRADDAWKKFVQNRRTDFGDLIAGFSDAHDKMLDDMKEVDEQLADPRKVFTRKAWTPGAATPKFQGPTIEEAGLSWKKEGGAITGAEDSDAVASQQANAQKEVSLREKISALEEQHAARAMTDQQQLNALLAKSSDLYYGQAAAAGDTNKELEARQAYLENQKAIDEVSLKMSQDKARTELQVTQEREKAASKAESELAQSQEITKELQLQLQGRDDLAERAKIEFDYDQKIKDAQEAIRVAEAKGFNGVAQTNRELEKQLGLEKQNALAAHDKAVAEEAAAKAAADRANAAQIQKGIDTSKGILADLQEQRAENEQIAQGHADIAQKMHEEWDWQIKIDDAYAAANDAFAKMNDEYAKNNKLSGDRYAEQGKINQAIAHELELQKQISAEQKAQQENQTRWREGMQKLANNLATIDPEQLGTRTGSGRFVTPGDPATTLATDPYSGRINETQLAYWQTYFQTHSLGGLVAQQVAGRQQQITQYQGGWGAVGVGDNGQAISLLRSIDRKLTLPPARTSPPAIQSGIPAAFPTR